MLDFKKRLMYEKQLFNETQATGIPMNRDDLELAGRNETSIPQT